MARIESAFWVGLLLLLSPAVFAAGDDEMEQEGAAVYECPATPRMQGCAPRGCALYMKGRTSSLVCAQCKNDEAYVLTDAGTRRAQCECAPGYAGKGMNGVCKKCPAGADIALGGSVSRSVCVKCPKGSFVNEASSECVCPAGTYKVTAEQPLGFAKMACKPCVARTAYVEENGHSQNSCNHCMAPQVANKDHSGCVSPDDAEAAPISDSTAPAGTRRSSSTFSELARAFEEGRMEGQQERVAQFDKPPLSPLQALAERLRKVLPDSRRATAEDEDDEYEGSFRPRYSKTAEPEESSEMEDGQEAETEEVVEEEDSDKQVQTEKVVEEKEVGEQVVTEKVVEEKEVDEQVVTEKIEEKKEISQQVGTEEVVEKKEISQQAEVEEVEQPAQAEANQVAAEEPLTKETKPEEPKESSHHDHDKEDDHGHHGGHGKDDEPGHHHGHDHDKGHSKSKENDEDDEEAKADPSLAAKLIPELAPEPEEEEKTESKAPEAPAGPVTLKDLAKKFGSAFGAAPNPVGNVFGRIDPEALADAGLPPVTNIGGLMGALVQKQIGDLDIAEWAEGIRAGPRE